MELDQVLSVPALTGGTNEMDESQLPKGLSEPQLAVLRLLASGRTLTEAAKGANISRGAIYRWMNASQLFIAAQEQIRRQMRQGLKIDVEALAADALMNIQLAVAAGKDPRLCLALLKYLGLLKPPEDSVDRP